MLGPFSEGTCTIDKWAARATLDGQAVRNRQFVMHHETNEKVTFGGRAKLSDNLLKGAMEGAKELGQIGKAG